MPIDPKSRAFTLILGLLAALPALSIDISAPTLNLLPAALDTSSVIAGLTLSFFMAGFALGQLGGGRISDGRGRRPVLLVGLTSYTLAALACALAPSGLALLAARGIQGVAAGSCSVLSFAMIQDLFEGDAARSKRSYVTVVFGIAPIVAPAIGSVLSDHLGWRAVHAVMAVAGALLLTTVWAGVTETRRPGAGQGTPGGSSGPLWTDYKFVTLCIANALSYAAIFAYIAGAPVVVIGRMGLSSGVFAALFACTAAALAAGAWTSGRLGRRGFDAPRLLRGSLSVAALACSLLVVATIMGSTAAVAMLPILMLVLFARGVSAPNLQHLAIDRRRANAGVASAAVGVSQLASGALASALVAALLPYLGASAVAIPMAMLAIAALLAWWLAERL